LQAKSFTKKYDEKRAMPLKIGQPAPPENLCKSVLKEKSEFVDWNKGEREEHDRKFNEILERLDRHEGIFAEAAFREGVKGVVEKYFGGKVQKWVYDLET